MTYYLVPLLIFYFGVVICVSYGRTSAPVLLVCALPMFLLVCLRGHAGTDTAAYYVAFTNLGSGAGYGGEPLFNLFASALWAIEPDARFVVNGISLTTAVLMIWAISRSRYGVWFGGLLIVPAMFYELTMNVMRFGLASSLFLLATRVPPQQKPLRYALYGVLAVGMHFSSAILFILFIVITRRRQNWMILLFAIFAIAGSFLMSSYISDKADLYANLVAPNPTSGLLFLLMQSSILITLVLFKRDFDLSRFGWWICVILAIALYALTQISYAGIRFQLILFYLMCTILFRQYAPASGRMSGRLGLCLLVIGTVAFAGRLHNMLDEEGRGRSPSLPYRVMPSLQE